MSSMREYKLNFWRHKTNEANRGFFPTSLDIVKMEMDLIDFSEAEENASLNICDLSGGTGEQLKFMHDYLIEKRLSPLSYYNEVTKERYSITTDKYKDTENLYYCNADFFNLKVRAESSKKVFSIIRNNPPYGWFDFKGSNVRLEDIFFVRNAEMNVDYGIQIFELPIHQLVEDKNLIRKIFYRYENIHIFKFPDQSFDKKQVCVIGTKKKNFTNDIELAEEWRRKLANEDILSLNEVDKPVIKLSSKAVNNPLITLFRDGKVTDETLTNGFNAVFSDLVNETAKVNSLDHDKGLKIPLIEQLPGHMALDIYSGQYDGLIGNVLVKGGVKKGVKVITENEKDKKTTTEIEILYPFVELTSANGTTLIKEHKFED